MKTTIAVFIIVIVSLIKQFIKRPFLSIGLIASEFAQKGLTISFVIKSVWKTFNPFSLTKFFLKTAFILPLKLIVNFIKEYSLLQVNNDKQYFGISYVRFVVTIWKSLKHSLKELSYYCKLCYTAPKLILEEFLLANKYSKHHLQFVSLCGRKVNFSYLEFMFIFI